VIPAGGFLVVGQSQDSFDNGGANVGLLWTGFTMDNVHGDTLSLTAGNEVSSFTFAAADIVPKQSIVPPSRAIDAAGGKFVCPARAATFGMNGALGTPGARNEACYPYALVNLPVAWEDISGFGAGLFAQNTDDAYTRVDLSSAPFTYFGVSRPAVWVDTNGHMAFADPGGAKYSNATTPTSASPAAMLAPFWDDLQVAAVPSQIFWARLPGLGANPGRWIIQFSHVTHLGAGDDLNFEVKLFDTGVIEFHYLGMTSGSTSTHYADGNSATIWMCAPDFSSAMPIGLNQAVIQPNSAYRFTPNP
jgi:hypothetical protein